jgi:hypothetical protein
MTAPGREQDLGFESPAQSSGRPAVRRGKQCSRRDQVHAHAVPTGAQNWKFCAGSRQAVSAAASRESRRYAPSATSGSLGRRNTALETATATAAR